MSGIEQIESIGRFELKNGVPKVVVGSGTSYTCQLIGDGSAVLYGSMDAKNWVWIARMESTADESDSFTGDHAWRYLKCDIAGTAIFYGNRG